MEPVYDELKEKALKIRRHIVEMIFLASSGHPRRSIITCRYFDSFIF